ncbi:hypothetical protein IVB69_12500 [Flavobacterium sp. J49]|uniref:hypothetical protein n=1 Tax=Flavobacterium sp. J49 TaxID=2718534 RepID=UPI001593010C|nr:hypothetical protein [Flavobacterium sp. J49]MBF6642303.1 hypothetical protein [Flavobacterium sp. J49]NIC03549.1 hypothetical protein [Flavobacterium sp. J49]
MRNIIILFIVGLAISVSSCREDFQFEPSTGDLTFSKDTVYLDTVFTNIGSSTYTLKVYNKSDKDISIPTIQLGRGQASKYRMTVDGMIGENNRVFHNVELLAKDSLYIFIEVTSDVALANPTDFLYTDVIEFRHGNGEVQDVDLVTLIQDAYFLYPRRFDDGTTETLPIGDEEVYGFFLDENDPVNGNEYVWGNDKPYVIYGYAAVPTGKTLNVQPGARVHFHAESGLIVGNGGSLRVNGQLSTTEALENEIIFEGDRLEPGFSDVPGQWGTIWLTDGSTNNYIEHLTLKNAVVGLLIDHNDGTTTTIKNSQIYDCSNMGIYAKTAKIYGENLVINTAGQYALACTLGGSYEFKHCTFNNNWSSSRQLAVRIDNYYTDNTTNQQVAFDLEQANFYNCIIFGSNQIELFLDKSTISPETNWTAPIFSKCQIKFNNVNNQFTNNPDYAFLNDTNEIIRNGTPDFLDIYNNKLFIGADSDAKNFGVDVGVPNDILGNPRNGVFDLGAYNSIVFPED